MAKPKVERTQHKTKELPPPTAVEAIPGARAPRISSGGVSLTNLAVKDRRDENRRDSLGAGLEGILGVSRQSGDGVIVGRAAEAQRFMAGGLRNSIKDEAGVLVEIGALEDERSGQHRSAIFIHQMTPWVEKIDAAMSTLRDAVRAFPRNAQRTSVAKAHEILIDAFAPLAKAGYRTVAAAALDLVTVKAAADNLDRFTLAGSERQLFMARLQAVQRDALVVVPERGKRLDRRAEIPQVVGFSVPTDKGQMPVGINTQTEQMIVISGARQRNKEDGSQESVSKKEIPLSEFLGRFGVACDQGETDKRYISQRIIEELRGKGVEAIALPAKEVDLLPEGILERVTGAEFVTQGASRQTATVLSLIQSLEEAVATEAKATLEEFDRVPEGKEESIVTTVARQQCAKDADDDAIENMRERIMSDFERNVRARLEVEYGLGGLRTIAAFGKYIAARESFPEQVGESVYRHGFPRRLSLFLKSQGWEGGNRTNEKGDRVKPDARFQELDKIQNRAGQTHRDKFMDRNVIEREIAVQSEAIREIRAALQEKDFGGFSPEALEEVLGEDAIQDYSKSYRDEVATLRETFEDYRKTARKAMGDAFAGVLMSRRSAIPGLIESDPTTEDGFNEREERMDLVRERMEVALGIQEDRFLKRGRKKSDDAEKVDRAIQNFLKLDGQGQFVDRNLALAIKDPMKIENERSPMLEALETFREVAVAVDGLEDAISTLRYDYEFANRLLRNAYPRDHKDDLMRPTSGAQTAVTPQTLNPLHPIDVIARNTTGGYLLYSARAATTGLFRLGFPIPMTRLDLPRVQDRNNIDDVRTVINAWVSTKGDLSPTKIVEGLDGVAMNRSGSRKLAWANIEPGPLFEILGIMPAGGYLPKIGTKLGAAWSQSHRDENGRYVRETFDRPHLPMPTTDAGRDRMVWFPLPEKADQVEECMTRLSTWLDQRSAARITEEALGKEEYPVIKNRYEQFKAEMLGRVRKSMTLYASGVRDFAWLAPSFGASGGVNSASILGFVAYRIPDKDAGERDFRVTYKYHGVEALKEVLRGFGETGCLVSPVIITADEEVPEGVAVKNN